jgi:membrane protein DedA with SNARE-associated domain
MPIAGILTEITDSVTSLVGDYGLYAVFGLMMIDAVFPAASEVVMVYAGAVAAGAFAGQSVSFLGIHFDDGALAYVAMALSGSLGYLVGAIGGWWIGARGGRPFLERHGRWFHLDSTKLDRAETWFERFGDRAVLIGRVTPVARSFISIPAGLFGAPFGRYVTLTAIGSAVWCFAFAGAGWAAGASWETVHDRFKVVDYLVLALVAAVIGVVALKLLRRRTSAA